MTSVRSAGIQRLTRDEARHLQRVLRLGQELAGTRIVPQKRGRRVAFAMKREEHELLDGTLTSPRAN